MLLGDILRIKYPNANFRTDICIQDDANGQGQYIKSWNLIGEPQPSVEQLEAWGIDAIVLSAYADQQNAIMNAPLIAQLEAIDLKSIRALRSNDTERLEELETQAIALRAQLVR